MQENDLCNAFAKHIHLDRYACAMCARISYLFISKAKDKENQNILSPVRKEELSNPNELSIK